MTPGEAALVYAKHGWAVFPVNSVRGGRCSCGKPNCKDIGKHPRTRHGHKDATLDITQIKQWWGECSDANVGIATGPSGLVVLDFDVDKGKDGFQSLVELEQEFGPLPETFTTRTGGGGQHRFFRAPVGRIGNRIGFRPGVDIIAHSGYVIAPPSSHASGDRYEVVEGASLERLADTPEWLVELGGKASPNGERPRQQAVPFDQPAVSRRIPEGRRNATLASWAGTMRAVGFDLPAIRAALLETNWTECDSPLEDSEVERIAASISRYPPNVPLAGGVFLPRDLLRRSPLRHRPNELRVFMHLLTNANWMPEHGLGTGEIRVSTRDLGRACAVHRNNKLGPLRESTVAAALKNLLKWGLIEVLGTDPETHLRIVNYEQYRGIPVGGEYSFEQGSEQL